MTAIRIARSIRNTKPANVIFWLLLLVLVSGVPPARAAGVTWSLPAQMLPRHKTSLQLAPIALTFTAPPGGPNPPAQHLTVTPPPLSPNLTWQASVTTTDGLNWLSATPTLSSGSGTITVTANPSGLAVGAYHGSVTVSDLACPANYATAAITLEVTLPLLSSLGNVTNVSGPETGPAHRGDTLRFSVTMTNVGLIDVTNIHSTVFQAPSSATVSIGNGKVQGEGTGFIATDDGFSGGTLAPGKTAVYTLDAIVNPTAAAGMAIFSLEVNGDGIIATPVVGRMRIVVDPAPAPQPRDWLPIIVR